MDTTLFVTCGRGLSPFAVEEIKEKIPDVTGIKALGEGKLSFTIKHRNMLQPEGIAGCGGRLAEEHPSPHHHIQLVTASATTKEENFSYITAIAPIFQLKLVERVFMMIHCEDIEGHYGSAAEQHSPLDTSTHNSILKIYEDKLANLVRSTDWGEMCQTVQLLRKYHASTTGPRVLCQHPTICPALTLTATSHQHQHHLNVKARHKRKPDYPSHGRSKKINMAYSLDNSSPGCGFLESCSRLSPKNYASIENVSSASPVCYTSEDNTTRKEQSVSVEETVTAIEVPGVAKQNCEELPMSDRLKDAYVLPCLQDGEGKKRNRYSEGIGSEARSFRVSCRVSGFYKTILTKNWLNQSLIQYLREKTLWTVNWRDPLVDLYVNITDFHFIVGVTLTPRPLSLRVYAAHLTLRSTLGYLVAHLAHLTPGATILDPMCGGGTILLEAATNFDVGHVIAGDVDTEQLQVAKCNLRTLSTPVSFLQAKATAVPMHNSSVNAVLCDFPFGHKHKVTGNDSELLRRVLLEMSRLLVCGGHAVFLLSPRQHHHLTNTTDTEGPTSSLHAQDLPLQHKDSHLVSMGETSAYVTIFVREERAGHLQEDV